MITRTFIGYILLKILFSFFVSYDIITTDSVIVSHLKDYRKSYFHFFLQKVDIFLKVTGIICEYNPLHLGHKRQLDHIRRSGSKIVCLMSGNYVQRGHPAIFDKMLRAEAALLCGADLVLELPITAALSSAEGFAAEGVRILSCMCDALSFGSETGDIAPIQETAKALLSQDFRNALRNALDTGISFPAARVAALRSLGLDEKTLLRPNDILAVEYCKAILSQESKLLPETILRNSDYHAMEADFCEPSATAIRSLISRRESWQDFVPQEAIAVFENGEAHSLSAGERAVLARLRTMSDADFEALPFGSEGLWRKLMHCARKETRLEDILAGAKSKRYTHTRLSRMLMCAYLGITAEQMAATAPYVRVLGFNRAGREILKKAREQGNFVNIGAQTDDPFEILENRADNLYGLFAEAAPEAPGLHEKRRVIVLD